MEKTIGERADEYIGHPYEVDEGVDTSLRRKAYIAGATEQKAIDIDKACEWLKNHLGVSNGAPEFIKAFHKAMTDKTE